MRNTTMKQSYKISVFVLFFICLFSSCITNKQKNYLQEEGQNKEYSMVPFQQYRLCVNDEIVYYLMTSSLETQRLYNGGSGASSLQSANTYRIYEDGCVVLPTIGRVKISGMTLKEAEKTITEAFKSVVIDSEVKISLANNYFYVQGDNGKGQFYMYKENLNIFQALAMAGDISSVGDKKHIKVIRKGINGDEVKTFDLRKESIIESEYYYVRPNDVIYIPTNSNSFFRVDSVSSFVSMFLAPVSLIVIVMSLFKI